MLCTETVSSTQTTTGSCSTTTCKTTSCGIDTTSTSTTTTTQGVYTAFEIAGDPPFTEDLNAPYVASIYSEVMSWWSVKEAYARPTTVSAGTTYICTGASVTTMACRTTPATPRATGLAKKAMNVLMDLCVDNGAVLGPNSGAAAVRYTWKNTLVTIVYVGSANCETLDFDSSPNETRHECVNRLTYGLNNCRAPRRTK